MALLPHAVVTWAGLDGQWANLPRPLRGKEPGSYLSDLPALNDGGYTFEQIADIIEEQL
jgi:hypothetical protein